MQNLFRQLVLLELGGGLTMLVEVLGLSSLGELELGTKLGVNLFETTREVFGGRHG